MKCDLLFFLLHNLSQAELRVEKVIVPNKTPASNSMKKNPFRVELATECKGHACATITLKKSLGLE